MLLQRWLTRWLPSKFLNRRLQDSRRWSRIRSGRVESLERRLLLTAETEPNNSFALADTLTTPNDSMVGEITDAADIDVFKVNLTHGQSVTVNFSGSSPSSPVAYHPRMELIGPDTISVLADSNDGRGFSYVVATAGTHYLRLSSAHAGSVFTGNYNISVAISEFTEVTESEANDSAATANPRRCVNSNAI